MREEEAPVGRLALWAAVGVVALMVVGGLVVAIVGALVKLAIYLLVGALVVGGGMYLVGRARGALRRGGFRQITGRRR
jgi:Family of unknown function (DUF5326)